MSSPLREEKGIQIIDYVMQEEEVKTESEN